VQEANWLEKLGEKKPVIAVVGLGYVGLPTALNFHDAGYRVVGIDVSEKVVETLESGKVHLSDTSFNVEIPIDSDSWNVTTDFADGIVASDVVLITVPTPVNNDKSPDLSFVRSAASSVLDNLNRNNRTIVVIESTVYPGVTREIVEELCQERGISLGTEVVPAYCPERVDPGPNGREIGAVAQIVGCDDVKVGVFLAEMFSEITSEKSTYVGKIEVAEAAKLIENVQRDIDIAFVNELAIVLPMIGVDVEEVLEAASTKWNFHRHTPGVGVGGHCIPVDPYYYITLAEKIGFPSALANASRQINSSMPIIAAEQIIDIVGSGNGAKILVLGYSYKPGLGDIRETPVEELTKKLSSAGNKVVIWDPLVRDEDFPEWAERIIDPLKLNEIDAVVLATAHQEVIEIEWSELASRCNKAVIFDGRRVLDRQEMEEVGWEYYGIGVPGK